MSEITPCTFTCKNGTNALIRVAWPEDAKDYLELAHSILEENIFSLTQKSELNMSVEQEAAWLKENLENPNHLVLVAEVEGKIVGQLDFSNGHRERIEHTGDFGMGIHQSFRGLGIGQALLGQLIEWAKKHAIIEKINLQVHETNFNAVSLYQKMGFQKEGIRLKELKYPNHYVNSVLMAKFVNL